MEFEIWKKEDSETNIGRTGAREDLFFLFALLNISGSKPYSIFKH